MSGTDVYYFLQHGKRLERPSRCPSSIYQTMLKCWEWDEKKRPTFAELFQSLKIDSNNRDIIKAMPLNATLSRKRTSKTVLGSSMLTEDNNRNITNENNSEHKNEQYKANGNGHVSKLITQFQ